VHRTGYRFGASHLVDVLLGADTARIRQLGHQELSVYGLGKELDRGQWRSLFRQLVNLGYLEADPEARGGLRFGPQEQVRPLLRGEISLALPLPAPSRERRTASSRDGGAPRPNPDDLSGNAAEAFQALKIWRLEQARQQGVPPYVVFHDRTLMEIARRRPASEAELAEVSGVGQAKLDRYGTDLLALLQRLI
jgi:ATP-dependent DNA helicase RecQ